MDTPIAGTQFGKMIFIGAILGGGKTKRWKRRWELVCHCGKNIHLRSSDVVNGKRVTCGCAIKKLVGSDSAMSPFVNKLIANYKKSSRVRRISWELSDDDCMRLFYAQCYYCGDAPNRILKSSSGCFSTKGVNGIDRLKI